MWTRSWESLNLSATKTDGCRIKTIRIREMTRYLNRFYTLPEVQIITSCPKSSILDVPFIFWWNLLNHTHSTYVVRVTAFGISQITSVAKTELDQVALEDNASDSCPRGDPLCKLNKNKCNVYVWAWSFHILFTKCTIAPHFNWSPKVTLDVREWLSISGW